MAHRIDIIDHAVIYENPTPTYCSRHGYFPGMVRLRSGELLALFPVGEAFESPTNRIHMSRSNDGGRTWSHAVLIHPDIKPGLGSMKPTLLRDGSLVAIGYASYPGPDGTWLNSKAGGMAPDGENLVSFSSDDGHGWSLPRTLHHRYPEMLETSGPCIQLKNGDLLAVCTPMPLHDGSNPTGHLGIALRSVDLGTIWDDTTIYYAQPPVAPYEARLCQMPDGRIVAITWSMDTSIGHCKPNEIVVSHDDGHTWSPPIDTGVPGQASNVYALDENRLLSIHCQREQDPVGVFVRVVDFSDDRWHELAVASIWDRAPALQISGFEDMGQNLRFGQPSLQHLGGNEYLAYHWAIEDGQGRIRGHRIRVV